MALLLLRTQLDLARWSGGGMPAVAGGGRVEMLVIN